MNFPTLIGNDLILNRIVCIKVLILVLFIGVLLFISLYYSKGTTVNVIMS